MLSIEEKRSVLSELIKMVLIDEELNDQEMEFIYKMAEILGLSDFEVLGLLDLYEEFTPPPMEFDRIVQFQRLVLAANLDMLVDSDEYNLLKSAGFRLGLHDAAVDTVLKEMKAHPKGILPSARLLEIFQVHHN